MPYSLVYMYISSGNDIRYICVNASCVILRKYMVPAPYLQLMFINVAALKETECRTTLKDSQKTLSCKSVYIGPT